MTAVHVGSQITKWRRCLLPGAASGLVGRGLLVRGTEKYMGARGLKGGEDEALSLSWVFRWGSLSGCDRCPKSLDAGVGLISSLVPANSGLQDLGQAAPLSGPLLFRL